MLKVAVTGAHGTGKTTLCNSLKRSLPDLGVCREVPRVIIEQVGDPDFFKRGHNTIDRQLLIFLYQLEEERKQARGHDILLCDRTPIDHLAYTLANHSRFSDSPEYIALKNLIADWLATFDLIFKVPIEFPLQDDGVREGAADFQTEIDRLIDRLYSELGTEVRVVKGTVEERTDIIKSVIQERLG